MKNIVKKVAGVLFIFLFGAIIPVLIAFAITVVGMVIPFVVFQKPPVFIVGFCFLSTIFFAITIDNNYRRWIERWV